MISRGGTDDSLIRINTNPLCDTLAYRNARSGGESRRMTQKYYYMWFSYLGADNTSPSDEWTNMSPNAVTQSLFALLDLVAD